MDKQTEKFCYAVINNNHEYLSFDNTIGEVWTSDILEAELCRNYKSTQFLAEMYNGKVIVLNLSIVSDPLSE